MLVLAKLTEHGLRHVVANLWERGRRELEVFGLDPVAAYIQLSSCIGELYSFEVRDGDEPIVAMGAVERADNHFFTWFLATEKFTNYGSELTRVVREFLAAQTALRPGAILEVVSASDYPGTDLWFRLLGFKLVGEHSGFRHFRYVSKNASDNARQ